MNQLSINKLKKMDPVGIRFNLHPIILFILALLGIYILYKAFWPKDKTYYRWKPANGAFLSSGQCKSMDNVASPALGNKYLPKHLRYVVEQLKLLMEQPFHNNGYVKINKRYYGSLLLTKMELIIQLINLLKAEPVRLDFM